MHAIFICFQMEDVVDQYKQPNTQDVDIDIVTHNNKQGNNFTEVFYDLCFTEFLLVINQKSSRPV